MPKMKTKSGAKKRFRVTATGKIKRSSPGKNHQPPPPPPPPPPRLQKGGYVDKGQQKTMRTLVYNR